MNERIRELAEQAITEKLSIDEFIEALKKEPYDFYGFRVSELQKFAQLIVRECALLCVSRPGPGDDVRSREHCGEQILQHFGVEL